VGRRVTAVISYPSIAFGCNLTVANSHRPGLLRRARLDDAAAVRALLAGAEPWPVGGLAALYLNRLAVHPGRQGKGLGSWCLAPIAEHCRATGFAAVRCDVLAANADLCAFYERHGYVERGRRSRSAFEFASYELLTSTPVRP